MSASSMSIPRGSGVGIAGSGGGNDSQDYLKNLQGKKKKASFECQHCTRKFATRSHLVRHSRVHTGERRYACDYPGCEMRCSRKDNLQQHYRTHLVVNPRKANAQSSLTVDPETNPTNEMAHHDFSDVNNLISPTEMKPIMNSIMTDPVSHEAPINNQVPTHPPPLGSSLVENNNDGPEREWSISPPPLSSAYDYWYVHGCLPHTVRNPASVSGSGSSGATSPEMSNALELAPGQGPRTYVDSPTTYYHPHSIPHGAPPPAVAYSSYDNEGGSTAMRSSFPLGTATFPSAADYQHPSASTTSSHHRSHSYTMGGGPSYHRMGYESASASPLVSHAHHNHGANNGIQAQARHSYSTESYEPSAAPYSSHGSRTIAYNPATSAASHAFHASATSIDGHQQQPQQHHTFHPHHSHSHSADSHGGYPGNDSRPVTRHGSLGGGYSIPVYPSHPHTTIAYGVPVDMPPHGHGHGHGHAPYGESPVQRHSMPVSVANSPRVSTSHLHAQQSPSLVLPPIRYTDGDVALHGGAPASAAAPYGMTSMGHFGNGSGWDRISVSDARALPPQQGHMGGQNATTAAGR